MEQFQQSAFGAGTAARRQLVQHHTPGEYVASRRRRLPAGLLRAGGDVPRYFGRWDPPIPVPGTPSATNHVFICPDNPCGKGLVRCNRSAQCWWWPVLDVGGAHPHMPARDEVFLKREALGFFSRETRMRPASLAFCRRCALTNHSHLSMPCDTSVNRSAVSRSPKSLAWSMPFRTAVPNAASADDSASTWLRPSTVLAGYSTQRGPLGYHPCRALCTKAEATRWTNLEASVTGDATRLARIAYSDRMRIPIVSLSLLRTARQFEPRQ